MNNEIEKQTQELVNMLQLVKTEFIKNKEELAVSVRIDVVSTQLKDILYNSSNYEELRSKLEDYIQNLFNYNKTNNSEK